jgi:predicted DNA-binding protein
VSRADYERLQTLADREGMTLSTYIRNQLFPEE